jgi:hypothetical protein
MKRKPSEPRPEYDEMARFLKHTIHDYDILSRLLSLAQLFDPAGLAIARGSSPPLLLIMRWAF